MLIREMQKEDLEQILKIEHDSFVEPWSQASFEAELEKHYALLLVAALSNEIIGYAVAWKIANELHIANLAVKAVYQRQGIATRFLNEMENRMPKLEWMELEVRQSNLAAINLYEKMGFFKIGTRKNYYQKENEDAILMVKMYDSG